MKKTYKSIIIIVTLLIILSLYIINSDYTIKSIINYSQLFLTKLFPASFIFFIFSSLLIDYGIIELIEKVLNKKSTKLYIFIISMISGFPSGAKYTKELYEKEYLTSKEANQCLLFSHFPNPLFVTGTANMIIKDSSLTIKLLLSIIISNFIIFISQKDNNYTYHPKKIPSNNFSSSLTTAIKDSFSTLMIIYGTSLFFYLIVTIIIKYIYLNTYLFVLVNGLFDLTKGVFSTSVLNVHIERAYFILFFISFGGISIHMQVKGILTNSDLSYLSFIKGRIIGSLISIIIFTFLLLI